MPLTWVRAGTSYRTRLLAATVLALALPLQPVVAHNPTAGDDYYPYSGGSYQEKFDWHSTYTPPSTWFQPQFKLAAETWWKTGNSTRAPQFTLDTSFNDNYIEYRPWSTAGCGSTYFDACVQYDSGTGYLKRIVYNNGTDWCEYPDTDPNGCKHIGRVALHELGHAAGLARGNNHSTESETYTVMRLVTPNKDSTGWNRMQLMRCDLIELQREYDISPLSSTYADCVDHLPAAGLRNGKIKTYATLNAPPSIACPNQSVTLTGQGVIANEPASLGLIANNPLSGRTMYVERRPSGGSWSDYGSTTVDNAKNWSLSVGGASSGTYDFKSDFRSAEVALSSDESVIFSITYTTPC